MMFSLSGKVALVTGAGQGVGAGIARAMAGQGATLVVNDFYADRAEATAQALREAGGEALAAPFDARDRQAVCAAVNRVVQEFSRLDIMVANVGTLPQGQGVTRFLDMPPEEWQQHIDNNLYSALNCFHAAATPMVKQRYGRLIAITSDAGRVGHVGSSIYGAAKAGMDGLVKNLAKELGPHGITANSIALGLINTVPEDFSRGAERHYAVGRIGTPEDVGAACVYLASEEAGWQSGHCLVLNGASFGG